MRITEKMEMGISCHTRATRSGTKRSFTVNEVYCE